MIFKALYSYRHFENFTVFSKHYLILICKPSYRQRPWWFDRPVIRTPKHVIQKAFKQTNEEREIIRQDRGTARARRYKANYFVWSHFSSWLSQSWDKGVLHCLGKTYLSKGRVNFPWLKKSSFVSHFSEFLRTNLCTNVAVVNRAVNTKSSLSVKFYKISMNDKKNAVVSPLLYLWVYLPPTLSHSLSQASQTQDITRCPDLYHWTKLPLKARIPLLLLCASGENLLRIFTPFIIGTALFLSWQMFM